MLAEVKIMRKIRISFISVIWLAVSIYTSRELIIPLGLAIALHEAGHLLCATALGVKITRLTLSPLGARMELESDVSYKDELLIAASGPIAGLLGFALTVRSFSSEAPLSCFSVISLALALFNLLPLSTLDGGRVARCLLCLCLPLEIAHRVARILSFLVIFSFWLFAVYVMIKFSGGLSAFVFCAIFFIKCFIFNKENGDL